MSHKDLIAELDLTKPPQDRSDARGRKLRIALAEAQAGRVMKKVMVLVADVERFRSETIVQARWRVVAAQGVTLEQFQPPSEQELTLFEDELPGPLAVGDMTLEEAADLAGCESVEQVETPSNYKPT